MKRGFLHHYKPFSFVDFVNQQNINIVFLIGLLIIICLYDLLSPPVSVTIYRQTQTAMLTDNFVKEGFSLKGLYLGLQGREGLKLVYEFPIYNFIVGLLFKLFNNNPFWGKLVSLFASIGTLIVFNRFVKSISNNLTAFYACLFLIFLPVDVLMFTSFQPDALGIMFMMISLYALNRWRNAPKITLIAGYSISLVLCGLCKYPLLVPYIPVCLVMYFFPQGKFRFPKTIELIIITALFVIPFVYWYLYRAFLTDPILLSYESKMFLMGDLKRFLSLGFYLRPAIMLGMLVMCVSGVVYFFSGLRRISKIELALLVGIPLYYFVVPTAAGQYYYLYAIAPIAAFFMAKGLNRAILYFQRRHIAFVTYLLCASFILFSLFGITYVLRMDRVVLPASEAMRQVGRPEDLIFVVNMHDRGVHIGGGNPTLVYLSGRNGWNVQVLKLVNVKNIIAQIEVKRKEDVRWLLVTWYTPDLEPWYSKFLPRQFARSPSFDSKYIADELRLRYPAARAGNNFAILSLS